MSGIISTHDYQTMCKIGGIVRVANYIPRGFFDLPYHIIPVYYGKAEAGIVGHWLLAVTKVSGTLSELLLQVHLMDSTPGDHHVQIAAYILKKFYQEIYRVQHDGRDLPDGSISFVRRHYGIQENDYDCGPFTLFFAWKFLRDEGFRSDIELPDGLADSGSASIGPVIRRKFADHWQRHHHERDGSQITQSPSERRKSKRLKRKH